MEDLNMDYKPIPRTETRTEIKARYEKHTSQYLNLRLNAMDIVEYGIARRILNSRNEYRNEGI